VEEVREVKEVKEVGEVAEVKEALCHCEPSRARRGNHFSIIENS
jgi:hypothetical protein